MTTFDQEQQLELSAFLEELDRADCTYVIPRGYRNLPESVPGVDLDILVSETDFERAKSVAEDRGFQREHHQRPIPIDLISRAVRKPRRATEVAVRNPRRIVNMVTDSDSETADSLRGQFRAFKAEKRGIHIDLQNHLAYTSPRNGNKVRVAPAVEESMFHNRKLSSFTYVPSAADELVHLVCRGIFDYHGDFPDYYIRRSKTLWDSIEANDSEHERFCDLLSLVFYNADDVVYRGVREGEYNELRGRLRRFDDY